MRTVRNQYRLKINLGEFSVSGKGLFILDRATQEMSDTNLTIDPSSVDGIKERRTKPRIYTPFPVKVRGVDVSGRKFEIDASLDNLSSGGLYLRLWRQVARGTKLLVLVRLSPIPARSISAMCVVALGVVLRTEPQPDGSCGFAVEFKRYRYF